MEENKPPSPEQLAQQLRMPAGELGTAVGISMNKSNLHLYDLVIPKMDLKNSDRILEIGFANGNFLEDLYKAAPGIHITGLDYSKDMVDEATAKNQQRINDGKLDLLVGNSDSIPFPDSTFDKVLCVNVIYFWDQPTDHLIEVNRVLKPGGEFYSCFRTRTAMSTFPFTKFGFILYEELEWRKILTDNNFTQIQTTQGFQSIEWDGKKVDLETLCMVGRKRN